MESPFSEDFKKQAEFYNLKYKCDDCIHFNEIKAACSFNNPTDKHAHSYILDYGSKHNPRFSFCKYIEIDWW